MGDFTQGWLHAITRAKKNFVQGSALQ